MSWNGSSKDDREHAQLLVVPDAPPVSRRRRCRMSHEQTGGAPVTSPRTPRQWGPGNSEPDRYLVLADLDGDLITYNREEEGDRTVGWRYVRVDGCAVSLPGVPWSDFDDEFDVSWPLSEVLPETPEPPEDDCPHCSPTHERPESRPWGVCVSPQRDGDGQPTHLVVMPSNGAHVAQSDADWLWQLIRDYRPTERQKL